MTNEKSVENEFIESLKGDDIQVNDDLLGETTPIKTESAPKPERDEEDDSPRNRREKRFVSDMEKIRKQSQEDREARIRAEERAAAILELGKRADASPDPDEMKFYGDTPEGRFARSFLEKKFQTVEEKAYQRTMDEIRKEQESVELENKKDSDDIDAGLSAVEEQFNVDLSGSTKESERERNGFIDFLSDLTTESFPDFVNSYEVYRQISKSQKSNQTTQRAKALAGRSMEGQGTAGAPQERKFRSGREYIDYLQHINS